MNTYLLRLLALLLMGLLLTGCNLGVYVPAHQNVPLLQKKGEVQVLLNTTNLQAAVAVGNHIGVAVNAQAIINGHKFLTPPEYFAVNQRRVELAVGYFTHQKTPKSPIFEVYVGGGMGKVSQRWGGLAQPVSTSASSTTGVVYGRDVSGEIAIQNWNLYVQPAIGIRRGMRSLSFSTKINYTGYTNATIQPEAAFPATGHPTGFDRLAQSHTLFIEPALTGAVGGRTLRVSLQVFGWFPVINSSGFDVIHADQTFVRLGLTLRLNQRLTG